MLLITVNFHHCPLRIQRKQTLYKQPPPLRRNQLKRTTRQHSPSIRKHRLRRMKANCRSLRTRRRQRICPCCSRPSLLHRKRQGPVPQPFVLRRRQHYFTNLPNIGLDAQPLRAPWEEAPSAEEPSEDDYDYPNGYKPAATGKAAMTVAVTVASVLAAAVIAFIIYLVVAKGDQFTALVSPPGAATADSVAQTTIVTEPPTDAPTDISVIMPDLDGLKEDEAYKLLNQSEVRYKVHRVFSVDVPSGYIVSQYPQPFSSFMRGSQEAIIYISKGKADEIHTTPTRPKTTKPK